jgi:hypothetical protein
LFFIIGILLLRWFGYTPVEAALCEEKLVLEALKAEVQVHTIWHCWVEVLRDVLRERKVLQFAAWTQSIYLLTLGIDD